MKLILKKWDSGFFKKKIGLLIINEKYKDMDKKIISHKLDRILRKANRERYKYILTKIPINSLRIIESLESFGFYLRDVVLEFVRRGESQNNKIKFIKEIHYAELEEVTGWAKYIFRHSFFYNDHFFNEEMVDEIHRQWIINLFSQPKTCFLTYRFKKKIVGFLIYEKKENNPNIVLFCVLPSFQNRYIATKLLVRMIKMIPRDTLITVNTQLKNFPALNCYLKCGFKFSNSLLTLSKVLER